MEFDEMVKLINTVSKSNLTKFTWKEGNIEVNLEVDRNSAAGGQTIVRVETPEQTVHLPGSASQEGEEALGGENLITSPLVGTFYNSPSPEAGPFVSVGDTVKKGQVIGIVEAMKLMNEIESEFDGIVEDILVENEMMVEYGQPLFRIK